MLEVKVLSKEYPVSRGSLSILSGVNFSLSPGDSASVTGPSGSGKSTLLYILGALEPPTSGTVTLDGRNPFDLDEAQLAAYRNQTIGFVFQDHHLLPQCSILENVLIPTLVAQQRTDRKEQEDQTEQRAAWLLEQVGLGGRIQHRPSELSGGERQRAAIARALIRRPRILLCDEPTGNLDQGSTDTVARLLLDLHEQEETILVVVTHNMELAQRFSREFRLSNGHLRLDPPS